MAPADVSFYTLEEHWISPALKDVFLADPVAQSRGGGPSIDQLSDVGPLRLADMDAGNVAIQVVSHGAAGAAAMHMVSEVRAANDQLADRVRAHPDRFRAFAVLAMADPAEAAAELRRCVRDLGFLGALVDGHVVSNTTGRASFYDSPDYDVLWAAAVELGVPIYLHPAYPPADEVLARGQGMYAAAAGADGTPSYPDSVALALGTSAWGWHSNDALGFLRLYMAGVFDRFPALQVVLGHMGEMLPYYLARSEQRLDPLRPEGAATLRQVWARNVHVTFGGYFGLDALPTLLAVTDSSRLMHSNDYPYNSAAKGKAFMETLRTSGLVSAEAYEDIAYRNAKKLLRI